MLQESASLLGLLADASRVRLLALLEGEELTVAELTQLTGLAQSRVSTHLKKLKAAGLVTLRKEGTSAFYRQHAAMPPEASSLWGFLRSQLEDNVLRSDRERRAALVASRDGGVDWAETVAGEMERHYSPGRTWQAMARGFVTLMELGDVLDAGSGDGSLAAMIAPRARSVTCLDRNAKVLAAAARRLARHPNVRLVQGELEALPFEDACFDQVLLFNVLPFVEDAAPAIDEAARVLRPGGLVSIVTLLEHDHADVAAGYGHVGSGHRPSELAAAMTRAGLNVELCEVTSRERRSPHFEVISAVARKKRKN